MCISTKILDMLYLVFISTHMVLKEKFGHLSQIHHYSFSTYHLCILGICKVVVNQTMPLSGNEKLEN